MLLQGLVDIQDLSVSSGQKKGRPLRSIILTKKTNNIYYLCIKNSMYTNCINYNLINLEKLHSKFVSEGKLGLRFNQPNHLVLLQADDVRLLDMFLRQIQDIASGKNVNIGSREMPKTVPVKKELVNRFHPDSKEFIGIERFDLRILNMRHLNKLVLENCTLPSLPEQIGSLPITYLSLTDSELAISQYERDTYWDWMSMNTISETLITLKLDNVGLLSLPFELSFLKNLHTLSVARNKLTYLPHFIGELRRLQCLFVADNMIRYFPDSLFTRIYNQLDISNNLFKEENSQDYDHVQLYKQFFNHEKLYGLRMTSFNVQKLSHLSFYSLIVNGVKFKRRDLPRTLWKYFNLTGRCIHCHKFVLPEYCRVQHSIAFPATSTLVRSHATTSLPWQSLICNYDCS